MAGYALPMSIRQAVGGGGRRCLVVRAGWVGNKIDNLKVTILVTMVQRVLCPIRRCGIATVNSRLLRVMCAKLDT